MTLLAIGPMLWTLCLLPWFISAQSEVPSSERIPLYLMGLVCFTGPLQHYGDVMRPALNMAIDDINSRDILPDYELRMIWRDTSCLAGEGIHSMYKELYRPPTKMMILGAGHSVISEVTAKSSYFWNLMQISSISESPGLSNKNLFPRFFRISSPYSVNGPAQLALMNTFNWKKIATIHQSVPVYSEGMTRLVLTLQENNVSIITSQIFVTDPLIQIQNLKLYDARIIVAGFNIDVAPRVFCEAYKVGLFGRKVVWIVPGNFEEKWWTLYSDVNVRCSPEQLAEAFEGSLGTDAITYDYRDVKGVSGLTSSEWLSQFQTSLNQTEAGIGYGSAGMSYDLAWAAASILSKTAKQLNATGSMKGLEDFTYEDSEMGDLMLKNAMQVSFQGVKGRIQFDENGDSTALIKVAQFRGGVKNVVGYFDSTSDENITWLPDSTIVWEGGSPPRDSTVRLKEMVFVELTTYIGICATASLGMLMSLAFLAFNIMFRNKRFIKMSSPVINNITILGCMLAYLTVFLQETADTSVLLMCKIRSYSLMLGFSIAFGALFAKTWRVYMIFTRTTKRTVLKDHQLVLIVVILAGIDVIIATVREILDPLIITQLKIGNVELNDGDTVITREIRFCTSDYEIYFKGVIFAIKGLLLIFGAFLSWQTRKVTIPALNDSQYIGICIYNIAVLSLLGVVLSFVLTEKVDLAYMFIGGFIVFGTTITQAIIFIPKIMKFTFSNTDDDEVNTQLGTVNGAAPMPDMLPAKIPVEIHENKTREIEEAKRVAETLRTEIEELKKG